MDDAAARRARRPIAHCGQCRGCAGERPQGRPPEEVSQRLTESPVRPRGPWDAPPLSPLSDPPNNIGHACQGGAVDSGSEAKGPLSAKPLPLQMAGTVMAKTIERERIGRGTSWSDRREPV